MCNISDEELYLTQIFLGVFSFFVFLVGLIMVFMLVRSRKHLVKYVRQVNGIRNALLPKESADLNFKNVLPTGSSIPKAFNPKNVYLLSIFLSIINCFSMFFAVYVFCCLVALIAQFSYIRIALKK